MTILTLDRKEFEKKVGKITKELEKKITDMGTPIEEVTSSEISVEVFPNRPDLLSIGNFSRAVNQFNKKGKIANFKINKPEKNYTVTIEKSVKSVRPHTVCAIVKGLKFNDEKIKEIVDIQEKLHNSIGRKRRKLAIGVYPLDKIKLPIRFIGRNPDDIKFQPLESSREMTGRQILRGHAAGREYGDILKDSTIFPIFIDANNEILSMPPIINSEKTGRINSTTKDIFIECSGSNLVYLKKCLNIILASVSEMGGRIYSMNIKDMKDGGFVSPDMSQEELKFKIKDIEKTLGIDLTEKDVRNYLAQMGIDYEKRKGSSMALIPAYRTDILHWIDLAEEVAIAYGYDNFIPEIPDISTIAYENLTDKIKRTIGNILAGLGLLETSSFHLTTKKNIKKMHYDFNEFIELEESKTERDVLRMDILTNLLQIASENSDAAYPQKTFEMGKVFSRKSSEDPEEEISEEESLAISLIDEKVNFTELKQVLDYLFKMLDVKYSIEPIDNSNYIIGRCGKIIVNEKDVGFIGEVAPRVLKNWKIKMPTAALEIKLDFLN
jgi:phenylalanyl-tRNA synthetase beta chain